MAALELILGPVQSRSQSMIPSSSFVSRLISDILSDTDFDGDYREERNSNFEFRIPRRRFESYYSGHKNSKIIFSFVVDLWSTLDGN